MVGVRVGVGQGVRRRRLSAPVVSEPLENLFPHGSTPGATQSDTAAYTLGMAFWTRRKGKVSAIWIQKSEADPTTARNIAIYPQGGGAALATGSSTGEPVGTKQWIRIALSAPVTVVPGTTYVAAAQFPNGRYTHQAAVFTAQQRTGNVLGLAGADSANGGQGNGRYVTGASIAYPGNTGSNGSYGVDIEFQADAWPSASNRGATGNLTTITGQVSLYTGGPYGKTLTNKRVNGWVIILEPNCTVSNCEINNTDGGVAGCIRVDTNASDGAGLLVENSTINGTGVTVNGIAGQGTFRGNKIVGCDNGINVYGPSTITDNYMHCGPTGTVSAHFDCIEINGGNNILAGWNTLETEAAQTSAFQMNNEFAGLNNIMAIGNRMSGGGYVVYCDNGKISEATNPVDEATIRIIYNLIGPAEFGPFALYSSGVVPVGNYDATGAAVN